MRPKTRQLLSIKIRSALLWVCCLAQMLPAAAREIRLDGIRLSAKDGLSCNTVNDITQDRDGFIWMATPNGISRYDGYQFVHFSQLREYTKDRGNHDVAQLFNDGQTNLIWGYSFNSLLCCYDLEEARFAEYYDDKVPQLLRNRFKSRHGVWLFSADFGLRHITYNKGTFHTVDYTVGNGKIAGDQQLQLVEDDRENIWIASDRGLNMVTPDHRSRLMLKDKRIIAMTCDGLHVAVLTDKGEAFLYDHTGTLRRRSLLPSMEGYAGKSRASFFWQGKWYIFTQDRTFAMDLKTGLFRKSELQIPNAMDKNSLPSYHFLYDKKGNAYLIGKKSKLFRKFHLLDNKAYIYGKDKYFAAAEDSEGKVYITSYGNGLFVYTPTDDRLQHFSSSDRHSLFHSDFLLDLYIDRSDCIWVSTESGVYCVHEAKEPDAELIRIEPNGRLEWSNSVCHLSHDGRHRLTVSTRANRTYTYDIQTGKATLTQQTAAGVYCRAVDPQGKTWTGTKGRGIYIDGINYSKFKKDHYAPSANFYDIVFDRKGRVWLATWGNGLLVTPQAADPKGKRTFHVFLNENGNEAQIRDLFIDHKGRLWVCTNDGIATADTNARHLTAKSFSKFNEDNGRLPVSKVCCGIPARDGSLWFATARGVIRCTYDEKGDRLDFKQFNTDNGLTDNNTRSLAEDPFGNIWVGTEEGLSCICAGTHAIRSFLPGYSISGNTFTENCAVTLHDGRIVMGVEDGMYVIRPTKASPTTRGKEQARVAFTDLIVNGISVYNDGYGEHPGKALNYAKSIVLPHNKNSLVLCFSNFDYPHIKNAIYQYYLEGADKTWWPATSRPYAESSNLNPGNYTLHVRTRTDGDTWSEETTFRITIRQPWYNTWWAWCLWLTIIGGTVCFFYRFWRRNFELSHQIALEKQMSDFRIDFFTHISHEFRTPLAIIQSAVEKMTDNREDRLSKHTVHTLTRGTKRLQRLINQLMEFRKANTGNMKLGVEPGDIVGFVRNIYNDFYTIARQKGIHMTFTPWSNRHEMLFDRQKVETIVYNLLSNAVKYTPDNGTINVRLYTDGHTLTFTVEDSGTGIKAEREDDLFKPFMHGYASKGGMGIGLYTARQMAELHKGALSYQRSAALGGSLFRLDLPDGDGPYLQEDFIGKDALDTHATDKEEVDRIVKEMAPLAINDVTVMVIEDDPDMMEQLQTELSVYFKVVGFMNGKTGYEHIKTVKPSLLVCDIMLPDMSGYEIVKHMKADPETRDIPVILLTALDDPSHKLKAYRNFADDYMVKPYNVKLLIARALQFVAAERKTTRGTVQEAAERNQPTESTVLMSTLDKKFKDKLEAIVAQHISDTDFNVDRLAELLNLGRTTVYNRTKSVMGVSPNVYIQNERLRIAAGMLLEGEYNVSEVSAKTGFSDATYFYKCFKNKYGIPPSKYGKKQSTSTVQDHAG